MRISCPSCTQPIELTEDVLSELAGTESFGCPNCGGAVPIPTVDSEGMANHQQVPAGLVEVSPPPAAAVAAPPRQKKKGIHWPVLIIGLFTLCALGGVAISLALKGNEKLLPIEEGMSYEEIQERYFTNLVVAGVTTEADLEAVTRIRPYGTQFIGVSEERMGLDAAKALAQRMGGEILKLQDTAIGPKEDLESWLYTNFKESLSEGAWVRRFSDSLVLKQAGGATRADEKFSFPVLIQWNGPELPMLAAHSAGSLFESPDVIVYLPMDSEGDFAKGSLRAQVKVHGNPIHTDSPAGEGLLFDGVDDYIDLGALTLPESWTLSFWGKMDRTSMWDKYFKFANGLKKDQIEAQIEPEGDLRVWGKQGFTFSVDPEIGKWRHFSLRVTGETVDLFVDGSVVGTLSKSPPVPLVRRKFCFLAAGAGDAGRPAVSPRPEASPYLKGAMDEVLLVGRRLTDKEIRSLNSRVDSVARSIVELNRDAPSNAYPWLSSDGLTIYWTREGKGNQGVPSKIWQANRDAVDVRWEGARAVAEGRLCAVSRDGLYLMMLVGNPPIQFHTCVRDSVDEDFGTPVLVRELAGEELPKSPWLSSDGNTLVFHRRKSVDETEFVLCQRSSFQDSWSTPVVLRLADDVNIGKIVTWPSLSDDLLSMWFASGPGRECQLTFASRSTLNEPFGNFHFLEDDGQPVFGRAPRFVEATNELFYCAPVGGNGWELRVRTMR